MLCEKCGNQVPDNVDFCTNCGNKISEGVNNKKNMKTKKIIFFGLLLCICLAIFISLSIKPKPEKNDELDTEKILEYLQSKYSEDVKKISEYLQNKYSEEFSDIELLSVMQNETDVRCDGSSFWKEKRKDDYTHYYKVHSDRNDMEFYAFINKRKTENGYVESISDNYSEYLTIRNSANEILEKMEKIFSNLIEYSYVTRGYNYSIEEDVSKQIDIKEDFGKLQQGIGVTYSDGYYRDNRLPISMHFKVNLSFKKISNNKLSDLMKLTRIVESLPEDIQDDFEIYIKTSDDYEFYISDSVFSHFSYDVLNDITSFSISYCDPEGNYYKLNGIES